MSLTISNFSKKLINIDGCIGSYLNEIKKYNVPTADEEAELLIKAKNGDDESKNLLILSHQRLIYAFAKRFAKDNNDLIDYVNEGNIGLLKAFEYYDVTKGFRFMTYASYYVRREMRFYFDKNNSMVEKCNRQKYEAKIKEVKSEFFNNNGFMPTVDIICDILNEKYDINIKDKSDVYDVIVDSYDVAKDNDENRSNNSMDWLTKNMLSYNDYECDIEHEQTKYFVQNILNTLTAKEADIIKMLYGIGEYTVAYSADDVALKYNVTTTCITSTRNKIIDKIKKNIKYRNAV